MPFPSKLRLIKFTCLGFTVIQTNLISRSFNALIQFQSQRSHPMSRNTEPNEIQDMVNGFLLLMACHALAGVVIFVVGFLVGMIWGNYIFLGVWIVGAMGFFVWQLFYVIPLVIRLRRRGKIAMMKGVLIGAVFTALVNGACFLTLRS